MLILKLDPYNKVLNLISAAEAAVKESGEAYSPVKLQQIRVASIPL